MFQGVSTILVIKILTVNEALELFDSRADFAKAVGIHSQHVTRHIDSKLVAVNSREEYTLVKNEEFWRG